MEETIHPFGFCYNPRLDKWTTTAAMVRERCRYSEMKLSYLTDNHRFSLTECGGKLYAIGGCSETAALEDEVSVEVYCTETDAWSVAPRIPGTHTRKTGGGHIGSDQG